MCQDLSTHRLPIMCPVLSGPSPVEVPYIPEPEYPEYLVPSDVEAPLEDQPLLVDASPIALSPVYVADSDPDKDLEEDPKEDHADYHADGGDGDDEPSDNDDDDDDTDDEDEEPFENEDDDEEEEHLTLTDYSAIPIVGHVPLAEDIEAFETDETAPTPIPSPRRHTARMFVKPQTPILLPSEAKIPSPPLPPPPSSLHLPPHVPTSLPLPSSPLLPLLALLFIPPPVDRREDLPEAELPPHKSLCLTTLTSRNEVGESLTAAPRPTRGHRADYGFISTMDAEIRRSTDVPRGVNARMTELAEVQEKDTQDIYAVIEDGQDRQTQLSQRVDVLIEDGQFHHETARLLDQEALVSQEAWAHSVGFSLAVHYELHAYRTHTQIQDYRIASQELLIVTLIAHISLLQGQLSAALGQIQALQARDQTHTNDPEGADNHNNIPPKRTSVVVARAAVAAAAAAPMTTVAVEQLIEARVSEELANHETL
ncbi:hypothetical protein Tco_0634877 [Tanacetum coccineum]